MGRVTRNRELHRHINFTTYGAVHEIPINHDLLGWKRRGNARPRAGRVERRAEKPIVQSMHQPYC